MLFVIHCYYLCLTLSRKIRNYFDRIPVLQ